MVPKCFKRLISSMIVLMSVNYIMYLMSGKTIVSLLSGPPHKKYNKKYVRSLNHSCVTPTKTQNFTNNIDFVPNIKFLLYIICHDEKSQEIARKWSKCMPWSRVVVVPSTVYFESAAYATVFPSLSHEWRGLDYVGVATYKSLKFLSLEKLKMSLELAMYRPYDVVPLYGTGEFLLAQAMAGHTEGFQLVWDTLLTTLGHSVASIRSVDCIEVFLRNTFVISPQWFARLGDFMNKSMQAVEQSAQLRSVLEQDAHYREGKPAVARRVFHQDFYHWHPFIFERLPVFYLAVSGAAIFSSLQQYRLFDNHLEPVEVLFKGL